MRKSKLIANNTLNDDDDDLGEIIGGPSISENFISQDHRISFPEIEKFSNKKRKIREEGNLENVLEDAVRESKASKENQEEPRESQSKKQKTKKCSSGVFIFMCCFSNVSFD